MNDKIDVIQKGQHMYVQLEGGLAVLRGYIDNLIVDIIPLNPAPSDELNTLGKCADHWSY